MRKRILGMTALFAVLVMVLAFTACDADFLNGGDDPDAEYSCIFINHSAAKISLTFSRGTPPTHILERADDLNDNTKTVTVTNKGKKIVLSSIAIVEPTLADPWDYIEFAPGSTANAGKSGKNGIELIGGTIIFQAVRGNEFLPYKIDALDD